MFYSRIAKEVAFNIDSTCISKCIFCIYLCYNFFSTLWLCIFDNSIKGLEGLAIISKIFEYFLISFLCDYLKQNK
jgi:hypothetical protein